MVLFMLVLDTGVLSLFSSRYIARTRLSGLKISGEGYDMVEKHNCGGNLRKVRVLVARRYGNLHTLAPVPGLRCSRCHEELISREVALALERMFYVQDRVRRRDRGGVMLTIQSPAIFLSPLEGIGTSTMRYEMSPVGTVPVHA